MSQRTKTSGDCARDRAASGAKNALMISSVASMLDNFNRSNIDILLSMGYKVTLAANFDTEEDINSREEIGSFAREMREKGCRIVQIDFTRKALRIGKHFRSYRQVRQLAEKGFDLVHCHSHICSALTRLAFRSERKKGTKVIYTAHGFYFFKGAPLKNWLLFFPVEWLCSWWTDVLITINREDYRLAKRCMRAKKVEYIPGVGVDTKKYSGCTADKAEKRKELAIPLDKFVLLSVGELQERKNQVAVIEALRALQDPDIVYCIAGTGELEGEYRRKIAAYGLEGSVRLLGYRRDVDELCRAADCFVHPSMREGLGIAALEAMASGLPLIASNVNGIRDYARDGVSGCCIDPGSEEEMRDAILRMKSDADFRHRCGENNIKTARRFDLSKSREIMEQTYGSLGGV